MSDQLEQRLERMLDRRAAAAGEGDTLVRNARERGQRLIRRRRITAGVACLAVLALGVPVGLNNLGTDEKVVVPTKTSTPQPKLPERTAEVTIDLGKLPEGPPPDLPYYADGAIHDDGRTVPIDKKGNEFVDFEPVADGYVVRLSYGSTARTMLIDSNGDKIRDLPPSERFPGGEKDAYLPYVSADGRSLVWSELQAGAAADRVVVADTRTGEVRADASFDYAERVYPAGFVGDRIVVTTDMATPGETKLWNPANDKVSPLPEAGSVVSTDGGDRLLAMPTDQNGCPGVLTARTGKPLWRSCEVYGDVYGWPVATHDSYLFAVNEVEPDEGMPLVLDPESGRRVLEIDGVRVDTSAGSEPDGDLLFVGIDYELGKSALVRCSLEGSCERASELGPPDADWKLPGDR